jgi:hypothetical protein
LVPPGVRRARSVELRPFKGRELTFCRSATVPKDDSVLSTEGAVAFTEMVVSDLPTDAGEC